MTTVVIIASFTFTLVYFILLLTGSTVYYQYWFNILSQYIIMVCLSAITLLLLHSFVFKLKILQEILPLLAIIIGYISSATKSVKREQNLVIFNAGGEELSSSFSKKKSIAPKVSTDEKVTENEDIDAQDKD